MTTRAEVTAFREAKRWAAGHVRIEQLGVALRDLVDAEVDLRIGRARPFGSRTPVDGWVGVVFARAEDTAAAVLVEVEPALAATLVARSLERPAPVLVNAATAPSPAIAGALAAVLLAAARRAPVGVAMRVLGAGPATPLEAPFAERDPEPWVVSLTVLVAHDAFAARVIVSRKSALTSPPAPWETATLAALGPIPLALPIVACATQVTAGELASLRPGDALVVGSRDATWPLSSRGQNGGPAGPVWLAAPCSSAGLPAHLAEDGRLVLRGGLEPLAFAETPMNRDENPAVVAALGEVPVVVRVEIGEAQMTAREWASLGRGDVIALGRRVGELVVLRVGGVPWARGELVELDGEVAVRIVEPLAVGDTA